MAEISASRSWYSALKGPREDFLACFIHAPRVLELSGKARRAHDAAASVEGLRPIAGKAQPSPGVGVSSTLPVLGHQILPGASGL